MELVRSFTVLGTDHRVQRCAKRTDSIKDPDYKQLLGQLLLHSNIDFIFEEAQALGPTLAEQIALEVLGPDRYEDVDPPKSAWGSLGIQETCKGFFIGELDFENQVWPYALEQTVLAHEKREQVWLAAILNRPSFESALMVCGCHHLLSFSFRFLQKNFQVKAFSYMPTIYDGCILRPKVQKTPLQEHQ